MILICYDGSADAKAAIARGGELMRGQPGTVLTVWQTFIGGLARSPSGFGLPPGAAVDTEKIDTVVRESAMQRAREGAELARQAGFDAQPRICVQATSAAETILSEAHAVGANAILMGSRGLTGLKSMFVGSVSHAVIQHADLPVIIVPSPDVASEREKARRDEEG